MIDEPGRPHVRRTHAPAVLRGVAALLVILLAVAAGRASAPDSAGGMRRTATDAAAHALVPVLRSASSTSAPAPTPTLLSPTFAQVTPIAWAAALLVGVAALLAPDRVRRWRARLVGAPPSPSRFRPH